MESVFVSFLGLSQTPAPNPCIISLYSSSPQIKPKKSQFSGLKWPFQPFLETPRIWPWMALTQQFLEQNHWMLKKPNKTRKNKKPPEEPIDISLPPNVTAWNGGIPFMLGSRLHWKQENVRIYLDGTTKVRYEFSEHFLREKYYKYIKHLSSLKRSFKPI